MDAPILARGVEIVDTPGTGYLDETSLAEALEFTARVVAEATGRRQLVYPVSARAALAEGGDRGFTAFAADFTAYLDADRVAGLEQSVTRHARRIAQSLLDEVALARQATRLPGDDAAAHIAAFAARLQAVTLRRAEAEDRAAAQSGHLLEALNASASQARAALTEDITGQMTALLDGDLAAAPTAGIERQGRAHLAALVATSAEAWRQEQARRLEDGLRSMDEKLAAELEAELAEVRAAAADLLGLDLALPAPGERLPGDAGFFYTLREHADQAELLAGAVRRRLPSEFGRRRARQRLLAQVAELADSQIGRARGDLQYRLAEATRELVADLGRRYAGSAERLAAALDRAGVIRAAAGQQGERELAGLAGRERRLRAVLSQLPDGAAAAAGGS